MFTAADFDAMAIPGLEGRMEAIKGVVRPKLLDLGRLLAPGLTALCGRPMYPKVALHARRTVNPPDDTWMAWSANPRGYKMLPHFQVGLWSTHAFIQVGVIYEAEGRAAYAGALLANLEQVRAALPPHYRWLEDYTQRHGTLHTDMTDADFRRMAQRLQTRKEADCMAGLEVPRAQAEALSPAAFVGLATEVFRHLLPVWQLAAGAPFDTAPV